MTEGDDYTDLATPDERQSWVKQNKLMYGGLIAIGVVILQGFLTAELDIPGKISVVAFAIALPLLAVLIMIAELPGSDKPTKRDEFIKGVALLSSITGVVAAFWHIAWFAGTAILVAGALGLGTYSSKFTNTTLTQRALRRARRQQPPA